MLLSRRTLQKRIRVQFTAGARIQAKTCIKLGREKNRLWLKSALPKILAHDKMSCDERTGTAYISVHICGRAFDLRSMSAIRRFPAWYSSCCLKRTRETAWREHLFDGIKYYDRWWWRECVPRRIIIFASEYNWVPNYLPELIYAPQFALEYVPGNFLEILKLPAVLATIGIVRQCGGYVMVLHIYLGRRYVY